MAERTSEEKAEIVKKFEEALPRIWEKARIKTEEELEKERMRLEKEKLNVQLFGS